MESKTLVGYVDPDNLIRQAVTKLITEFGNYKVSLEAADAESALQALEKSQPNILVTEIGLPGRSGIDLLLELRRRKLDMRVIVLSRMDSEAVVRQALASGALSYVLKRSSSEDLKSALEAAVRGEAFLPEALAFAKEPPASAAVAPEKLMADPLAALSPREREIFFLLAGGDHNTVIAKKLFISPRTVETHRSRVVRKLGLVSNAELIRFAIRHGLSVVS